VTRAAIPKRGSSTHPLEPACPVRIPAATGALYLTHATHHDVNGPDGLAPRVEGSAPKQFGQSAYITPVARSRRDSAGNHRPSSSQYLSIGQETANATLESDPATGRYRVDNARTPGCTHRGRRYRYRRSGIRYAVLQQSIRCHRQRKKRDLPGVTSDHTDTRRLAAGRENRLYAAPHQMCAYMIYYDRTGLDVPKQTGRGSPR